MERRGKGGERGGRGKERGEAGARREGRRGQTAVVAISQGLEKGVGLEKHWKAWRIGCGV